MRPLSNIYWWFPASELGPDRCLHGSQLLREPRPRAGRGGDVVPALWPQPVHGLHRGGGDQGPGQVQPGPLLRHVLWQRAVEQARSRDPGQVRELTIRHRMSFVTRYEMEGLEVTTNMTYNTDTYKPVILWDIYEVGERHIISSSPIQLLINILTSKRFS